MNNVIKEFNAKAATYETNRLSSWYKAHAEIITHLTANIPDGLFVDIGCATGYLLRQLATSRTNSFIGHGIDISPSMVAYAQQYTAQANMNNLTFSCLDFEKAPLDHIAPRSAQAVICANTAHYFHDLNNACARMRSLLTDGGKCILVDRELSKSLLSSVWNTIHTRFLHDTTGFHSSTTLLTALRGAGFSHATVRHTIRRYFWHNKLHTSIVFIEATK